MPYMIPTGPPGTAKREILEVLRDRGSGREINLVAHFTPAIGKHLLETRLFPGQTGATLDDGWIEIRASVPDSGRLRWWLMGFGVNVEIIEPIELREVFRRQAQAMLARYGGDCGVEGKFGVFGTLVIPENLRSANDDDFD